MTSLYLIRHAQAMGNVQNRFQGRTDLDLTDLGHKQVGQVALRMRGIPLSAIYSSPLQRAWKTAKGIASPQGLEPIRCDGIVEINGGAMENTSMDVLRQRYPVEFNQFLLEPHNFQGVGGGESFAAVYSRMRDAVLELVEHNKGENIAVISHGAAIRCFMAYISGLSLERMNELGWGGNTSVCHITFHKGSATIHTLFDDSHLSDYTDDKQPAVSEA